jgi:hypothetical protein
VNPGRDQAQSPVDQTGLENIPTHNKTAFVSPRRGLNTGPSRLFSAQPGRETLLVSPSWKQTTSESAQREATAAATSASTYNTKTSVENISFSPVLMSSSSDSSLVRT